MNPAALQPALAPPPEILLVLADAALKSLLLLAAAALLADSANTAQFHRFAFFIFNLIHPDGSLMGHPISDSLPEHPVLPHP